MKKYAKYLGILLVATMLIPAFPLASAQEDCAYNEAPMLADMVAAGELPPVCERLPANPLVIETGTLQPAENLELEIGKYSDQLVKAGTWGFEPTRQPLWETSNLGLDFQPAILEVPVVNEDNTEFTFKIREGLKWSDGVPVTTEDIQFTFEDVIFNEEIFPNLPLMFRTSGSSDGSPITWEIVDEYTFKVFFDAPYGAFLDMLGQNELSGYERILKPKHYLQQFHIKYADEAELAAMLEEEGLTDWYELFNMKDHRGWDVMVTSKMDTPSLNPWIAELNEGGRIVAVRNPYYFEVDAAGNQLPYFDRIVGVSAPEGSSALLMAMAGEVDFGGGGWADIPLMLENQGDTYTVAFWPDNGSRGFYLNLTLDDPVWREIVLDIRFRQAINMAIDREEINEDVYAGTGTITTVVPSEYDPDGANALLDEMGLTERDGDGFRLRPDGETFLIEVDLGPWAEYFDPLPFIADHLKQVGIKVDYKQIDPNLLWERLAANEIGGRYDWNRANTWGLRHNHGYLPLDSWAPLWVDWVGTGGETGEEPPDWIKELYTIGEEIMATAPGTAEADAAADKLYDWYYENIPYFIVIDGPVYPPMINNRIGNVPTGGYGHANSRVWKVFYDKTAD